MASYSAIIDCDELERCSLNTSSSNSKSVKKSNYGSLRTEVKSTTSPGACLVNYEHRMCAGDTIQGLSLKYGVPVSEF